MRPLGGTARAAASDLRRPCDGTLSVGWTGMAAVSRLTRWLAGAGPSASSAIGALEAGDDWRLWRLAGEGDGDAATQLVRRLTPQAYGLALRLLGRPEDAEDAVQDGFARLWRSAPSDDRGAGLATYFNTIVINRCRSQLAGRRELATDQDVLADLQDAAQQAQGGPAVGDEAAQAAAGSRRLAEALDRLPPRQRMAIVMWAWADASVADIARSLDVDPNAAHQLLHRAKRALRGHLPGIEP